MILGISEHLGVLLHLGDLRVDIETATHVLEGIGFESNERLTSYRVLKPQGIFPVPEDDAAKTDTHNQ